MIVPESAPEGWPLHFKILSIGQGDAADTLRLEVEIHRSLAEWLGKIGARFFPIYGEIEERLKRQRDAAKA